MSASAARVRLYYNEKMAVHTHEWPHVEKCTRAMHAFDHLKKAGLLQQVQLLDGHKATDKELMTVHTQRHIDEVRRMTDAAKADPTNRQLREPDGPGGVYYSPGADAAARLACGCVIDAACAVLRESKGSASRVPPAFAIVRPPGHHAGADNTPGHHAEGFCFFNSVAVAAGVVLGSGAAKRVAILDWDVHHGNGTQDIFYDDGRVLYVSLHRFGERWYPETGEVHETGDGDGVGATLNVPWPENGYSDTDYLAAFKLVVLPVLKAFAPDLLLISAGFDAAEGDAQGKMRVSPTGFGCMTELLLNALSCPVAAALEGGYNSLVTCECCEATLRGLLGESFSEPPPQLLTPSCEATLRAVIEVHKVHWPVLNYRKKVLDDFFAEAARIGCAPRASKRARIAPTFADEEVSSARKSSSTPDARKKKKEERALARAVRRAARNAAAGASVSAVSAAEKEVKAARKRLRDAEEEVKRAEGALEAARAAADKVAAEADASSEEEEEEEEEEDDTEGTNSPRGTVLWSHKVRCEVGRRVFAQYGVDADELWFRGTVVGVHRSDIGQWVDVEYDDGDTEHMKPIKRVRALDEDSSSDESDDDDDEDEGDEGGKGREANGKA